LASTGKYDTIYKLQGGILHYLETIPLLDSLWKGECFVFDQRVTVQHGLVKGHCVLCRGCRRPLTELDQQRSDYLPNIHCRYCIDKVTEDKIKSASERQLQIELSRKRNETHLGYKHCKKKENEKAENSVSSVSTILVVMDETEIEEIRENL
jgi:UPF0176 protein